MELVERALVESDAAREGFTFDESAMRALYAIGDRAVRAVAAVSAAAAAASLSFWMSKFELTSRCTTRDYPLKSPFNRWGCRWAHSIRGLFWGEKSWGLQGPPAGRGKAGAKGID